MESEESLSLEKQNSEKNISVENSSPVKLPSKATVEKQSKSADINIPDNNKKIARIEVKSRQHTNAKAYQMKSFKSDFVVFVQLNKYKRSKNIKIFTGSENNINYIIIPTKKVKSLKRRKTPNTWGRYRVNIGYLPSYKKYENDLGWTLIKKFLKIRG